MTKKIQAFLWACGVWAVVLSPLPAQSEVILQYFQMSWRDLTQKMPELAEAGYSALWLPPPTKASGGLSVGYDLWDPFDLGGKDQRSTIRTRYGTEAELHEMMRAAHRFGIRVYFDNIMNHRAFDIPGFNESTPIDVYPGMRPEDFHLRVTEDGFYRKWDNTRDWNDEWQVTHLGLSDLIDIAHEVGAGGWNHNFGPTEGSHHPGISFVRHPDNPEYYAYDPMGNYVGFGNVTQQMLDENPGAYTEDVNAYLIRAARWLMDRTKADGLRLDAVKHVPAYFFGAPGDDNNSGGYTGGVQLQFNLTRGFSDGNHRDTLFNIEVPRDDAMIFGEHLGQPPAFGPYIERGMRLKDAPLRDKLNGILGSPWGDLSGMDQAGHSGNPAFSHRTGVQFAHSHDSDYSSARELQYAYYMTRAGLPIVYTDGYFKAGTLQDSGGAFPRHANTAFLGQFGDPRLPNLAYIREHFARGGANNDGSDGQRGHWADNDVVAYSRVDKRREGWGDPSGLYKDIDDRDGAVLLFMMNDNYADGQSRSFTTSFPAGAYLYQYARGPAAGGDSMQGFYITLGDDNGWGVYPGNTIPRGGYFAFSWRSPEESALWQAAGGSPITIYEDGQEAGTMRYTRRDGPTGDEQFNPFGLSNRGYPQDETPEPYRYQVTIPRVTSGTNLSFVSRVDGSAINVLMKLNGGMDLNSHLGIGNQSDTGRRDRPPAIATDTFLGWEDTQFSKRIGPEKFGSPDASRNKIGSMGSASYEFIVGQSGFTIDPGPEDENDFDHTYTASFVYHDPAALTDDPAELAQLRPQPENAENEDIWFQVKTGHQFDINRVYVYYTTDGQTWPEGAGGVGRGNTKVLELAFRTNVVNSPHTNDWWSENFIPAMPTGTVVRYKVSALRQQDGSSDAPWDVPFPSNAGNVDRKYNMMGVWQITNFNATTVEYFPHNDWAQDLDSNMLTTTGMVEGMNFIQARAFLERDFRSPIYNTFKQVFYLDLERPSGEVLYPSPNDTLFSSEFGVVVHTDPTVTEVWFTIEDSDDANDDGQTGQSNGNGTNELGAVSWMPASEVAISPDDYGPFEREWRFTYRNIPASGQATIRVRMLELSSSTNMTLSDVDGHFTTTNVLVNTSGPEQRLFVAWPQNDGDIVGEGYELKAYFSKSLADNTNFEQLRDRFTIRINDAAQGKAAYDINYNETEDYHALTFNLPNLYNGDPDYLHQIEVTHQIPDGVLLRAFREVRAWPTEEVAQLTITDPEQFDSNGRQTEIFIPDLASPDPEDRQYVIQVDADPEILNVWIEFDNENTGAELLEGPLTNGSTMVWQFLWTNLYPATFTFQAFGNTVDATENHQSVSDLRSIPVRLRELVEADDSGDSDNDGIPDEDEVTQTPLPITDSEFWTNGDVHMWRITGRTDPLMPNTDGGGLPDGLQSGLEGPVVPANTDENDDTNGDGWPNFIADRDPPIFNTLDNSSHPRYDFNRSRTDQLSGSMTDPARPDTDGDNLLDSAEDLNRNGRVDVGLLNSSGVVVNVMRSWKEDSGNWLPTVYNTSRVDRDALPAGAIFLETDPNNTDTIGDGLTDGQSDVNGNGRVDMVLMDSNGDTNVFDITATNNWQYLYGMDSASRTALASVGETAIVSRAVNYDALFAAFGRPVYDHGASNWVAGTTNVWPRILLQETDPLTPDTNNDGLPDGWKVRYGLDPFDDGWYNLRTGVMHATNSQQGADGDITGDGYTNWDHFLNGTDPRIPITLVPPPEDKIILGPGDPIGEVDGIPRFSEFNDWTWDDLRALDAYEGGGNNHQGGDIFPAWDGWDSSRDLVAFYTRDGGALPTGTGEVYFRLDFHDLQAFAEQGNVDLYVAINWADGGERVLPDQVDTLTQMRWRAVAAVYESAFGQVYVDTNPGQNTDNFTQDLFSYGGVQARPDYFLGAYYNSELDAMEFAISRQALTEAGWNGANPADLRFQVFSTKSGTQNSPQGSGDLGGRSDIRDSIYNNSIAEDHWAAQAGLRGDGSVLWDWIPGGNRPGRVKVALVVHGNQHIRPGSEIMALVNNNAGTGYYRPIDAHEVYGVPLNLHITPTLASAIQWAKVDPALNQPWRDGPSFNQRLADLMDQGIISLFATTFSDHILPYFTPEYNNDNVALANEFLETIYGVDMSEAKVFFPPERVLDADVLNKIGAMGYEYTLVDQMMHLRRWLGRETALGQDGFRINRLHGVNTFAINDQVSSFRFDMHDGGASMALRRQLNRMARSGTQDQVLLVYSAWDDFLDADNADAYDALVRWLANRAWVDVVTLEDIANDQVDLTGDGNGDAFSQIDRGSPSLDKIAHDWIQYATRNNYDNWYVGQDGFREGLEELVFEVRPGVPLPQEYGMLYSGGLVSNTWDQIRDIAHATVGPLGRAVMHASTFVTAFHNQPGESVNLSKFSTGDYVTLDNDFRDVAALARHAQSQTRHASVMARVAQWADSAHSITNTHVSAEDIDWDGENEYLIYNPRIFGVMERTGGRMVGAWIRYEGDNRVFQTVGNFMSYAGADTEFEGAYSAQSNGQVVAYRTSALKDWWAGTDFFVNTEYTFTNWTNGWRAVSSDGNITKTVTVNNDSTWFDVHYQVDNDLNSGVLYVRHGLSPDLMGLLLHGQDRLSDLSDSGGILSLTQEHPDDVSVAAMVAYGVDANQAGFNATAVDDDPGQGVNFSTINMRNQAQTHQVELVGTNDFRFALGFDVLPSAWLDSDGDGIPDWWERDNYGGPTNAVASAPIASGEHNTLEAFIAGLDPNNPNARFGVDDALPEGQGFRLRWNSVADRMYHIYRSTNLTAIGGGFDLIQTDVPATPPENLYLDDEVFGPMYHYRIEVELDN